MPLLATQILWINLLTDARAGAGDGRRPAARRRHGAARRGGSTDRVIDAEMWVGIVWVGAVMAVVTLLALDLRLPGGLVGGSGDIVEARTMAFTTLVLAQLFNCFNARSDRTSAFHQPVHEPLLWGAIALSVAAPGRRRAAAVPQRRLRHRRRSALDDWLICVGLASVVLWADEAKKLLATPAATPDRSGRRTRDQRPRRAARHT